MTRGGAGVCRVEGEEEGVGAGGVTTRVVGGSDPGSAWDGGGATVWDGVGCWVEGEEEGEGVGGEVVGEGGSCDGTARVEEVGVGVGGDAARVVGGSDPGRAWGGGGATVCGGVGC